MPWQARDTMSLRREFVELAVQDHVNRRALCRRFGVSPKTAYKWIERFGREGVLGLADQSRRPHASPDRSAIHLEAAVVGLRRQHPAWGGRKIARRLLEREGTRVAPSTATAILHRYGLIPPEASAAATAWQRFEHPEPNALWQIDFKGHFDTPGGRCHPLTALDDHSRFNLILKSCPRTDWRTVQPAFIEAFRRYGLPVRLNADNGAPWGAPSAPRSRPLAPERLVHPRGHPRLPQPGAPSADQWQAGTFPSHPEGRSAERSGVRESGCRATGLRPVAPGLQLRTTP